MVGDAKVSYLSRESAYALSAQAVTSSSSLRPVVVVGAAGWMGDERRRRTTHAKSTLYPSIVMLLRSHRFKKLQGEDHSCPLLAS